MSLTFERLAEMNLQRCQAPDGFSHDLLSWTMSDWVTATVGELGEAANIIKKLNRDRDNIRGNTDSVALLTHKLTREIGDTLIYLDLLTQRAGLSLEDCVVAAFDEKSLEIGYSRRLGPDPRTVMDRGSGRTTTQLTNAPRDAIYVYRGSRDYYEGLREKLGRHDITLVPDTVADRSVWRGTERQVRIDHAAVVPDRIREEISHHNGRYE